MAVRNGLLHNNASKFNFRYDFWLGDVKMNEVTSFVTDASLKSNAFTKI